MFKTAGALLIPRKTSSRHNFEILIIQIQIQVEISPPFRILTPRTRISTEERNMIGNLCGSNNTFEVLPTNHIGSCFLQLCLVCPIHALLAAVNVFYLAKYSTFPIRTHGFVPGFLAKLLKINQFLSVAVAIIVVTQAACSGGNLQTFHPPSYYLSLAFMAFAWVLTGLNFCHKHRPSISLCLLIVLSWGTTVVEFSSFIIRLNKHISIIDVEHRIENFGLLLRLVLQTSIVLILMILRVKWPSNNVLNTRLHSGIQSEQSETDKLLTSQDYQVYYSGLQNEASQELLIVDENAHILSRMTFWWVVKLMEKGLKGEIKVAEDVFCLPPSLGTKSIAESFKNTLQSLQKEASKPNVLNSKKDLQTSSATDGQARFLLTALHKAFGVRYYSIGILKFIGDCLGFAGPLLLHALVSFMENKSEPIEHGYYYAAGLFSSTLIGALISTHYGYEVNKVGLQIRAAVITSVYHKTLAVKSTGLFTFSTGEVVNFMSTDTDRIVNFCPSFHQFWSLPFQIAISLYLLYQQVGLSFLAGLCFALLLIPVNKWLAVKIRKYSEAMMEKKDSRVKAMNEILYGIRVIKFYAWEQIFSAKIHDLRISLQYLPSAHDLCSGEAKHSNRDGELKNLKLMKYLDAWCVYFWATTPVLISILTFCTYVLLGNTLTAAKVFTSIALFNMLIFPLNVFPWVINGLIEAWVSLKRVNKFLILEELDLKTFYLTNAGRKYDQPDDDDDAIISVSNGDFTWGNSHLKMSSNLEGSDEHVQNSSISGDAVGRKEVPGSNIEDDSFSSQSCLLNVCLSIKKGQLIGVVGKVGSGKSSLLSAITAEMDKTRGRIFVANLEMGFGMACQEPWIQHASVKDNILFGKPFDQSKYETILKACALEEDLKILPAHDQTEVGENGVTLSGGQKSRIALARALYQDKEIYLLDDPLASVDTHVASHIFTHCIMGFLKNKTRILCTHHRKYLQDADLIVVMDHNQIICAGLPHEVLKNDFVIRQISEIEIGDEDQKANDDKNAVDETEDTFDSGLVEEEEKDVGVVKYDVYRSYLQAAGACLTFSILLSLFLMQTSRNISDWWLAHWISNENKTSSDGSSSLTDMHHMTWSHPSPNYDSSEDTNHLKIKKGSLTFYLVVYGGIAAANSIFTLCRAFLFAYGGIKAARVIHKNLLNSILLAPVSFFDVTPIGRVVNRFSSDTYSIDDSLPFMMNIFLAQLYGVAGTIAITCYGLPWFTLVLLPLAFFYYKIQNYYRKTSREVKRLMTVSLSPIYAHFSETLNGISTIRALRATQRFSEDNKQKLELNQRANFTGLAASQWLSLNLQMLGVAMVTCVSFIAVLEHHFSSVNPGLVGLAISYALTVTNQLSGLVSSFTETEKQMVSVERAMQYVNGVPKEVNGLHIPPLHWPSQGKITFNQVSLIYRRGLPPALRQVSFETLPCEKIGIVGRTGSGKSSLFLVLFKIVSLESGQVIIDDIDIASLNLQKLRSSLAIIPQDPFLFSDSVRKNVDPTEKYDDAQLWHVLERCYLKDAVQELGGLQASVGERGRNLSCGQRQLICLARALLTHAKVLCIDEATASVDFETDRLIQKTIREEFKLSTVLTIAHRIETILDSDRVLVLDKGSVSEFASPAELQEDKQSLFSNLVNNS